MLTLYTLLISALGSSVIAMPTGTRSEPYEPRPLEGNEDERLFAGKWVRLMERKVELGQAARPSPPPTWTAAASCDDSLQFVRSSIPGPLKEINVLRVVRKLEPGNTYVVDRDENGNGLTEMVYPAVPSAKWIGFLMNTFWGREPDIVGQVSDGVLTWKC